MTLQEFYKVMGGDYESVKNRMIKEEIIRRFLWKFLNEPSYFMLQQALEKGDYRKAFLAAHSLKGVCGNLGMEALGSCASQMTELLRNQNEGGPDVKKCSSCFDSLTREYTHAAEAIKSLDTDGHD